MRETSDVYLPKVFSAPDTELAHRFVREHGFGTLIASRGDGPPEIAHLPFLLDTPDRGSPTLRVHVARANPIWKLVATQSSTVVFQGPHTYISPTWYGTPAEHVPTWNYAVVHAHCDAATILDEAGLATVLEDLTAQYEGPRLERGQPGWRPSDVDATFRGKLMQQIVGFSLPIRRFEAKLKLSQNREPGDRLRVMDRLRERGEPDDLAMLRWMKTGD